MLHGQNLLLTLYYFKYPNSVYFLITHFNSFYMYDNVIMQGFIPQITLPTRVSHTCDTLNDNIFANNVGDNHVNGVLFYVISDR